MRIWREVMGKIKGKGKRSGWAKGQGTRKEGCSPGSEKGSLARTGKVAYVKVIENWSGLQICQFSPYHCQ